MTTISVPSPAIPVSGLQGRAGLRQTVRSEWTKFWSVRSTAWSLVVMLVAVLGICILATTVGTSGPHDHVLDPTRRSLTGLFLAQLAIGVLGVLVMSAEYGTGSIRSTLAATPRRPVVLGAKIIVLGFVSLVAGQLLSFMAFFIGQALLPSAVGHATLSQPGVARAVAGSGLFIAVLGLLALGLATIIRHTAGAIAAFVGIVLVLPLVVQALPTSIIHAVTRYLPEAIGLNILSTTSSPFAGTPIFSPWAGLAILFGYAVASLVVGGWIMTRRDA
jgi:ABC-2 type transport system permease protein